MQLKKSLRQIHVLLIRVFFVSSISLIESTMERLRYLIFRLIFLIIIDLKHLLVSPNWCYWLVFLFNFILFLLLFQMADVCLSQLPELYKDHAKTDRDDVQILYGGSIGNVKAIGHYITIFYKASEERVYVYDSFFSRSLSRVQQEIVETLYPKAKYVRHVKPATRQPNGTSCGVFAIASATHLILGKNPKNTTIKLDEGVFFRDRTMTMRNHLKDMLLAGKLSQFPA